MKKMWKRILAFMLVIGMTATMTDYSSLIVVQAAETSYENTYYNGSETRAESFVLNGGKIASIFTAQTLTEHRTQRLRAITLPLEEAGISYSYQIYKDLTNPADPESGVPVYRTEQTGTSVENEIDRYIDLNTSTSVLQEENSLLVANGETFSVVVTLISTLGGDPMINFLGSTPTGGSGYMKVTGASDWILMRASGVYYTPSICAYTDGNGPDEYPMTTLNLDQETLDMRLGTTENPAESQTVQLTATFTPDYTTNRGLTWTSSDTSVATVSATGLVTAQSVGTTVIRVESAGASDLYKECTVTVKNDISCMPITAEDQYYTGSELCPVVITDEAGTPLTEYDAETGEGDYSIVYANNVDARATSGNPATATITGRNDYAGSVEVSFDILQRDIATLSYDAIDNCISNGTQHTPEVQLYFMDGETRVDVPAVAGPSLTNYTIEYGENNTLGDGTITVSAGTSANFTGEKEITFKIGLNMELVAIETANVSYTGGTVEPALTVTNRSNTPGLLNGTLIEGRDYEIVSYANNIEARASGHAEAPSVTIRALNGSNYAGTKTQTFTIEACSFSGNNNIRIEVQNADNLIGAVNTPVEPEIVVTDISLPEGEQTLAEGTDYSVSYSDNMSGSGTGVVTITGMGNYKDRKSQEFAIKESLDDAAIAFTNPSAIIYSGEGLEPEFTVTTLGGTLPRVDADTGEENFTVEWSENVNAGVNTASVKITGTGGYVGSKTQTFTILPKSIENMTADDSGFGISYAESIPYTGEVLVPELTLTYNNRAMTEVADGVGDFVVSGDEDKNINATNGEKTAEVTVQGQGNYTGTAKLYFAITGKSVESLTMDEVRVEYDGSAQEPKITVRDGEKELAAGENQATAEAGDDYTVSFDNNVEQGMNTAKAIITGVGNYTGTKEFTFTITKRILGEAHEYRIEGIENQAYTGAILKQENLKIIDVERNVELVAGENRLSETADYYVTYGDPSSILNTSGISTFGTVSLTIRGLNNYDGNITVNYDIKYDLSVEDATTITVQDQIYTGSACEPSGTNVVVTYRSPTTNRVSTLRSGSDYVLSYENNIEAGIGTATITVTGNGNYQGSVSKRFSIKYDISALDNVDIDAGNQIYTGEPKVDGIAVYYKGPYGGAPTSEVLMVENDDYTLSFTNNVNATTGSSQATVLISAVEGSLFVGSVSKSFSIGKADLSSANVTVEDQSYTGTACEPDPIVMLGETRLIKGTDYTVSYGGETVDIGTNQASVTITGTGNYEGSKTVTYSIVKKDIEETDVVIGEIASQAYTGQAIRVDNLISLTYAGNKLVAGRDYEIVSYENNTEQGQATINLQGIGSFEGDIAIHFYIVLDISNMTVAISEGPYTYSGSAITPLPVVTLANGFTLDPSYYDVIYSENINAGQGSVTIRAKAQLAVGEKTVSFTIGKKSIGTGATVAEDIELTIGRCEYNGDPLERVEPEITITYNGVPLIYQTDYTLSFDNNFGAKTEADVNPPTVTISGRGTNFSGSIVKHFSIEKADFATSTDITVSNVYDIIYKTDVAQSSGFNGFKQDTTNITVKYKDKTLVEGTDYIITYGGNTKIGIATMFITATASSQYFQGQKEYSYRIKGELSNCTIMSGETPWADLPTSFDYNGNPITFPLQISFDYGDSVTPTIELTEGVDYTVTYENNVVAGANTAKVTIEGIGLFIGTIEKTYSIQGVLNNVTIAGTTIDTQAYTGLPIEPNPTIRLNGATTPLVGGSRDSDTADYYVEYANNTNIGVATVRIVGINKYKGEATLNFDIKYNLQDVNSVTASAIPSQEYTGSVLTPRVAMQNVWTGLALTSDDYEIEAADFRNAGQTEVTVTGKGNYFGTKKLPFTITQQSIDKYYEITSITSSSMIYNGSAMLQESVVVGKKATAPLTAPLIINNVDYTISYQSNINAGTATVAVIGQQNYTGTISRTYTIQRKNIADTDSAIKTIQIEGVEDVVYDGTEHTPEVRVVYYPNGIGTEPAINLSIGEEGSDSDVYLEYHNNKDASKTNLGNVGRAEVRICGQNNYQGETSVYFTIEQKDLSELVYADLADVVYTGQAQKPELDVRYIVDRTNTQVLTSADYTATYSRNVNVGTANVKIEAVKDRAGVYNGNYKGTYELEFDITRRSLSDDAVVIDEIADQDYTGAEVQVPSNWHMTLNADGAATVLREYSALTSSGDYTLEYENNIASGYQTATVTIEAVKDADGNYTGNYEGSATRSYTIGKDISTAEILGVSDSYVYAGQEITTDNLLKNMIVRSDDTARSVLTPYNEENGLGDYKLAYRNNKNITSPARVASVTVEGCEGYFGSIEKQFEITQKDLSAIDVPCTIANQEYNGSALEPLPQMLWGTEELALNSDYTITYEDNTELGTATATITGIGNYRGTRQVTFRVLEKSLAAEDILVRDIAPQIYTGGEIRPDLTDCITFSGNILQEGADADYTVEYVQNVNAGVASVLITGHGNYTGVKTVHFEIHADLKDAVLSCEPQEYTGEELTPGVTVRCGGNVLTQDVDFTATYLNNIEQGRGTAIVSATIEDGTYYFGSKETGFDIVYDIASSEIRGVADEYTYTGGSIRPAVEVISGYTGEVLSSSDYTVAYRNNVDAGTGSVVLTGRGNYTGTQIYSYDILQKNINNCTFSSAANVVYNGSYMTPSITVRDGSKTLVPGSDYAITYTSNRRPGRATITIEGTGNYEGTRKIYFNIETGTTTNVRSSSVKTNSVKLSWTKVNGATGYEIYTADSSTRVTTVKKNSVTLKSLRAGNIYQYKVRAYITTNGVKHYGAFSSVITLATKPARPSLAVSSTRRDRTNVRWTTQNCTGYELYRARAKKGRYVKIRTIGRTATRTYTDTNVVTGMKCYYKVRAYRTVNGKKVYSSFSIVKSVTVK